MDVGYQAQKQEHETQNCAHDGDHFGVFRTSAAWIAPHGSLSLSVALFLNDFAHNDFADCLAFPARSARRVMHPGLPRHPLQHQTPGLPLSLMARRHQQPSDSFAESLTAES